MKRRTIDDIYNETLAALDAAEWSSRAFVVEDAIALLKRHPGFALELRGPPVAGFMAQQELYAALERGGGRMYGDADHYWRAEHAMRTVNGATLHRVTIAWTPRGEGAEPEADAVRIVASYAEGGRS